MTHLTPHSATTPSAIPGAPRPRLRIASALTLALVALLAPVTAEAAPLEILYFNSPTCPFCVQVAERDLAPLREAHGASIRLVPIDITTDAGREAFLQACDHFELPRERHGVPMVVIADRVLVGAAQIPEELPGLVETHLARGVGARPALPALDDLPTGADGQPAPRGWWERFVGDMPGNAVAALLLIAMLGLLAAALPRRDWQARLGARVSLPARLAVAGLGLLAASYLSLAYLTETPLICGPLGRCDIVQHSDMAWLFGLIPIAFLGVIAYLTLIAIYLVGRLRPEGLGRYGPSAALVVSGAGFAFSILLTFWQPFVIGATCAWCLLSALTMTLSFLAAVGPGRRQLAELRARPRS